MFLVYAHNDYRKENGSRVVGLYPTLDAAQSSFTQCLSILCQAEDSDSEFKYISEEGAFYPDGWGLRMLPTSGLVHRCTRVDSVLLMLVELELS